MTTYQISQNIKSFFELSKNVSDSIDRNESYKENFEMLEQVYAHTVNNVTQKCLNFFQIHDKVSVKLHLS